MATKDKSIEPVYLLAGKPVSVTDAQQHLAEFYGARKDDVIAGLDSGKYSCATTGVGVIYQINAVPFR